MPSTCDGPALGIVVPWHGSRDRRNTQGFGAGDTSFYEKAQERMTRFLSSAGTLLLASHSDELLRRFCRRGLVFDSGRIVFSGPLENALEYYHRNHASGSPVRLAS